MVDNGLQVSKIVVDNESNKNCLDNEVYKIHSWMVADREIAKGYNF